MKVYSPLNPKYRGPLDTRHSVASYSNLNDLKVQGVDYPYMKVVTRDTGKEYRLNPNGSWEEVRLEVEVINNLDSDSTQSALSAKMGKTLSNTKLSLDSRSLGYKRVYGIDETGSQVSIPITYGIYDEIRKCSEYLYETKYSILDYNNAYKYFEDRRVDISGSCSVVKRGNIIGRNFDWTYDENVSFIVHTSGNENRYASVGISGGATNLTKTIVESGEFSDAYKIVPFLLVDGVNECGVFIEENVVPQDYGRTTGTLPQVELKETLCSLMVVRFVLDHFSSSKEAVEYLRDYTSIYIPKGLDDMNYDVHFFISDKENTYIVEFIENEIQILDITEENKIMTNFHLYGTTMDENHKVIINRDGSGENSSGVTKNGSGLERYNLIVDNYENISDSEDMRETLDLLKYTYSYDPSHKGFWYTEFTGINGLDVTSPVSSYTATINDAANKFAHRSRNRESQYFGTWQTTHSAVYDLDKHVLKLCVQEGNNEISIPLVHKEICYVYPESSTPIKIGKMGDKDLYSCRFQTTGPHSVFTVIGSIPENTHVVKIYGCFYGMYNGKRIIGPLTDNYGNGWNNSCQFWGNDLQVSHGNQITSMEIFVEFYYE